MSGQAPGQLDAGGSEGGQVEGAVVGSADQLERGFVAGGDRVRRLVDGAVEAADALQPPVDVHAAVAARQSGVTADGEDDVPSGVGEFVGELHPGGRGADDQHAAGRQRGRAAVGRRSDLGDGGVEVVGDGRDGGLVAPAGGDHDVAGPPGLARGDDVEAVVDAGEVDDGAVFSHGSGRGVGVALEVGGDLGGGHVAVGVGAGVGPAGQAAHPVRGQQAQGVPALAAPALGDSAALEHDVVDAPVAEAAAGGEAGLAGADDDGVGDGHGRSWVTRGCRGPAGGVGPPAGSAGMVSRRRPRSRPGRRW